MVKKEKILDKQVTIDVYSSYSDASIECVSPEDELDALQAFDSYHEFENERKYYD